MAAMEDIGNLFSPFFYFIFFFNLYREVGGEGCMNALLGQNSYLK